MGIILCRTDGTFNGFCSFFFPALTYWATIMAFLTELNGTTFEFFVQLPTESSSHYGVKQKTTQKITRLSIQHSAFSISFCIDILIIFRLTIQLNTENAELATGNKKSCRNRNNSKSIIDNRQSTIDNLSWSPRQDSNLGPID
jgi:hypothetical protein